MGFLDDIINSESAKKYVDQGTEEWHKLRLGRFTSSEIHKLITEPKAVKDKEAGRLGETGYGYVNDRVAEIMTGQAKQQGYAFPLVYGKETEPVAIEAFVDKTGFKWESCGFYPYTDHAGGSPDGIINEEDILEVKCPYDSGKQVEYLMLNDQFDLMRFNKDYYWQCQANLLFTGMKQCHFVCFDPRMIEEKNRLQHIIIKPNNEHHDLLIKKIEVAVKEKLSILKLLRDGIN